MLVCLNPNPSLSLSPAKKIMKNNIIMWTESDDMERACLKDALKGATQPIQDAMKWFEWEGEHLTCSPKTLEEGKEHWRNLYFYLSGYGDAQFQSGLPERKQPAAIPQGQTIVWCKDTGMPVKECQCQRHRSFAGSDRSGPEIIQSLRREGWVDNMTATVLISQDFTMVKVVWPDGTTTESRIDQARLSINSIEGR